MIRIKINLRILKMNKYTWLVVCIILLIITICALVEIDKCSKHFKFKAYLPKEYYLILPCYSGFQYPIIVYNTSKITKDKIFENEHINGINYRDIRIHEHIVSKIETKCRKFANKCKRVKYSKTPINSLYSSLLPFGSLMNDINPLNVNKNKYKVIVHNEDVINQKFDIFINRDMLILT